MAALDMIWPCISPVVLTFRVSFMDLGVLNSLREQRSGLDAEYQFRVLISIAVAEPIARLRYRDWRVPSLRRHAASPLNWA